MQIRCPACKKKNFKKNFCQRCGTDLSLLIAIRSASRRYLKQSRKDIMMGNGENALICAQNAWDLEHTPQAARQAFMSCLLLKKFDQATKWYALANHQQTPSKKH